MYIQISPATVDEIKTSLSLLHKRLDSLEKNVNPPETPDYLTRKQAAQRLCCSLVAMNNYLRSGKIPYKRIGRKVLIPYSAIQNLG